MPFSGRIGCRNVSHPRGPEIRNSQSQGTQFALAQPLGEGKSHEAVVESQRVQIAGESVCSINEDSEHLSGDRLTLTGRSHHLIMNLESEVSEPEASM